MDLNKLLRTLDSISEGTMKSAAKHERGPKFTGYWKGTDKATPGKKMVGGGACESVLTDLEKEGKKRTLEWTLRKEYEQYIAEYGMTTGGMNSANPEGSTQTDAQKMQQAQQTAKDNANIQKTMQNLKTVAPDINVPKTATALTKAETDQDLTNIDKDSSAELAAPVADIVKDPQLAGQFKQLVTKAQQKDKMQQVQQAAQQQTPGTM
jgi:hypothetical protein